MFVAKFYLVAALFFSTLSFFLPHWFLIGLSVWVAFALYIVSIAYLFDIPHVFRKKSDGSIPFYIHWVLWPFFLGVQLYNSWARKNDKTPAIQKIEDNLYLACRLFPSDVEHLQSLGVGAILDATSEFSGLNWSAEDKDLAYLNVPVLDHQAPKKDDVVNAVNWIQHQMKKNRKVVVHCALGRGRSVLIVAAYLIAIGKHDSAEKALSFINGIRGTARLNKSQLRKLQAMHDSGVLTDKQSILLVANPVSGGGSWKEAQQLIEQRLSTAFNIDIKTTTPELTAAQITRDNIDKGYTIIAACGGDGTVNEVASVLTNTDQRMAIIPLGTTNALSHVLMSYRSKISPVDTACDVILQSNNIAIDTARCNDDIMLLVAGVGFEHRMIEKADRQRKNALGEAAYIEALGTALFNNETRSYWLTVDSGEAEKVEASSIIIANAAPATSVLAQGDGEPDPKDGMLDMTILNTKQQVAVPFMELCLRGLTNNALGSGDNAGISHKKITSLKIRSDSDIQYVIDGEVRDQSEITVKIMPKSLNMMCLAV